MPLTKDAILAAADRPREAVNVPEWGGEVLVQAMSAADRDSFEALAVKAEEENRLFADWRAQVCVRCLVDEEGKRLFSDADAALLGAKGTRGLRRIYRVAARLSGLGKDAAEELEGN